MEEEKRTGTARAGRKLVGGQRVENKGKSGARESEDEQGWWALPLVAKKTGIESTGGRQRRLRGTFLPVPEDEVTGVGTCVVYLDTWVRS